MAKQAENYEGAAERKEEREFEQKPLLKFNEFNDEEKAEIKKIRCEKNKKRKSQLSDEEQHAKKQKKNGRKQGEREGNVGKTRCAQQKV